MAVRPVLVVFLATAHALLVAITWRGLFMAESQAAMWEAGSRLYLAVVVPAFAWFVAAVLAVSRTASRATFCAVALLLPVLASAQSSDPTGGTIAVRDSATGTRIPNVGDATNSGIRTAATPGSNRTVTDTLSSDEDTVAISTLGAGSVSFDARGTFVGDVVTECTSDGANWLLHTFSLNIASGNYESTRSSFPWVGIFSYATAASQCRLRADTYTSGSLTVTLQASPAAVTMLNPNGNVNQGGSGDPADPWFIAVTNTADAPVKPGDSVNNAIRVNVVAGGGSGGTSQTDNTALGSITGGGALYDTTPPSVTDGNVGAFRMNSDRQLMTEVAVSALPSGAATSANQSTEITALQLIDNLPVTQGSTTSGQSGVLAQGAVTTAAPSYTNNQTSPLSLTTSGAVRTDSSAVTQPVSGTVTANAGTGNFTVVQGTGTNLHVVCDSGCGGPASFADNSAFTFGTTNIGNIGYVFDDTAPNSVTENNAATPRMSANRVPYGQIRDAAGNERGANVTAANALVVDGSAVTQPVSGTVGVSTTAFGITQSGTNNDVDVATIAAGDNNIGNVDVVTLPNITIGAAAVALQVYGNDTIDTPIGGGMVISAGRASAAAPSDVSADGDAQAFWVLRNGSVVTTPSFGGTLAAAGNGTTTAGTQRVTLSSDSTGQVAVASFPDNEPINVAQIAGTTTTTNNGTVGAGTQRVTLASDSTGNIATIGTSITPGTSATHLGKAEDAGVTSGDTGVATLLQREDTPTSTTSANNEYIAPKANLWGHQFMATMCEDPNLATSVAISQTALNGNAELVALTASQVIYVCGYDWVTSAAVSIRLVYGTGSACATGETGLTGAAPFAANSGIVKEPHGVMKTASANALCIETSGAANVMGSLQYVKF